MRKACVAFLVAATLLYLVGCSNSFVFPDEDQFELLVEVNKKEFTVGEELEVEGVFINHSEHNYKLSSSATFSQTCLIHMNLYEQGEEELFLVGAIKKVTLRGNDKRVEPQKYKLEKPGVYKLVASSFFDITNPDTSESKEYLVKAETVYIEVSPGN